MLASFRFAVLNGKGAAGTASGHRIVKSDAARRQEMEPFS
jgi:hypothetical protein